MSLEKINSLNQLYLLLSAQHNIDPKEASLEYPFLLRKSFTTVHLGTGAFWAW